MPPPSPQFYDATYTTPVSVAIPTGNIAAGTTYGPDTLDIANDKGGVIGSEPLVDANLRAEVDTGAGWVTSGHPALEEAWYHVRFTGTVDDTGDPSMEAQETSFTPVGTNRY